MSPARTLPSGRAGTYHVPVLLAEVETLLGDPSKAKDKLGWTPKISFDELVAEMVREDLKAAERDELVKKHGYKAMDYHE